MKLVEEQWSLTTPWALVEADVGDALGETVRQEGDEQVWTGRVAFGFYRQEFRVNPDRGTVSNRIHITDYWRPVSIAFVLLAPFFVVGIPWLAMSHSPYALARVYFLEMGFYWATFVPLMLRDGVLETQALEVLEGKARQTAKTTHPLVFSHGLVTLVVSWGFLRFVPTIPSLLAHVFLVLGVGILLLEGFIEDGLPGISIGSGSQLLHIPIQAITSMTAAVALALGFVVILGYAGGAILAETDSGIVARMFLDVIVRTLPAVSLIIILMLAMVLIQFLFGSRRRLRKLRQTELSSFDSTLARALIFGWFLAANAVILAGSLIVVVIIGSGILNDLMWPTAAFWGMSVGPLTARKMLTLVYLLLDSYHSLFPILPARVYSVALLTLLFSPALSFGNMWLANLYEELRTKYRVLVTSDRREPASDVLPEDVQLLVLENDTAGAATVRPVTVLFGSRRYVAISQHVLEELTVEERTAVLAHEGYHLENRDLLVNAVASLLSILFGGRNALLVFYDYPAIEAEADRVAAEVTGADTVVSAIRKLEHLSTRSETLRLGTPGFSRDTAAEFSPGMATDARARFIERIRQFRQYTKAPYQLFFGRVLLDAAHLETEDRIQRLMEYRDSSDSGDSTSS